MQSMSSNSIVMKIPYHTKLDDFKNRKIWSRFHRKRLMALTSQRKCKLDILAEKIPKEMKKLVKLLERANKIEDAIKIEQELGRITETIELLKEK